MPEEKGRFRRRLSSFKSEREAVRQCFLFSNYMIIATRYLDFIGLYLSIDCFKNLIFFH